MFFKKKKKNTPKSVSPNTPKNISDTPSIQLSPDTIAVGLEAKNKEDAITQIADFLIGQEVCSQEYKEGMLAREKEVSTYLMNGVAIPHGVKQSLQYIKKPGIFIGQFPKGIVWNEEGDKVYLVCGLASTNDAHMEVLSTLTMLIQDKEAVEPLFITKNIQDILSVFSTPTTDEDSDTLDTQVSPISSTYKTIMFTGENGMHARPATFLAKLAKSHTNTEVCINTETKMANAKSMPSILTLNITPNTLITISAKGADEVQAVQELVEYIENTLNHEKAILAQDAEDENLQVYDTLPLEEDTRYLEGTKVARGVVFAEAFVLTEEECDIHTDFSSVSEELASLENTIKKAQEQLRTLTEEMQEQNMKDESEIFESHFEILNDELIIDMLTQKITKDSVTAAQAASEIFLQQAENFSQLEDPLLQARSADMKDIRKRLLQIFSGAEDSFSLPKDTPFILVAEDLSPTQIATLTRYPVKGICTALGGAFSHMAILARALAIPTIVALGKEILTIENKQEIILNAQSGRVLLNPSQELILKAETLSNKYKQQELRELEEAHEIASTQDGVVIEVLCNIANSQDAQIVTEKGGEGVGLFRTEFLFEHSRVAPDVDTQYKEVLKVAQTLENLPITIRVMDIGGDKPVAWLPMEKENNPFLGVRGIRLLLSHTALFKQQLQSIYQVAKWQQDNNKPITCKIMLPMISFTYEIEQAKALCKEVQKELQAPDIPIGIMVETPASVFLIKNLHKLVDFYSIGTNDLTQYTLAMDRMHPELSKQSDSLHPSILSLIQMTVENAHTHDIPVSVCGDMAANPVGLIALLAMGVRRVSISPAITPATKYLIRRLNTKDLDEIKSQIMTASTSTEIRTICEEFFQNNIAPTL